MGAIWAIFGCVTHHGAWDEMRWDEPANAHRRKARFSAEEHG